MRGPGSGQFQTRTLNMVTSLVTVEWSGSSVTGRANVATCGRGRAQPVIATSSASFSDGFINLSVLRGRLLRLAAMRARSSAP